jgi:predicted transcriptional regulator
MPLTKDSPDYKKMASLLSILGDADSLELLNYAVKGFKSGKTSIKDLGISPRKYYRNLKALTDSGLIRNYEGCYTLTPMGRVLHQLMFSELEGLLNTNHNASDYLETVNRTKEITIIDNYDKLIKTVVNTIDNSNTEILLATRFIDFSVIQSISCALERNVKINTLNDPKLDYPAFFKLIEGIHRDIRPNIANFFVDPEKKFRSANVPLSFIVIDNEITLFEVPNSTFRAAFLSTDKQIVKVLSELFWEIWQQSKSLNVPSW